MTTTSQLKACTGSHQRPAHRVGQSLTDWKFSEVCVYLGYWEAVQFVEFVLRFTIKQEIIEAFNLIKTYRAFVAANVAGN
jgi:hypothetical protein